MPAMAEGQRGEWGWLQAGRSGDPETSRRYIGAPPAPRCALRASLWAPAAAVLQCTGVCIAIRAPAAAAT